MSKSNIEILDFLNRKIKDEKVSDEEREIYKALISLVKRDTPAFIKPEPCAIWGNVKIHCPRCNVLFVHNSIINIQDIYCEKCGQHLTTEK